MLNGTPAKAFKSSGVTTQYALSTASHSSSQMVDEQESTFSFSLPNMGGLFDKGVGISSIEVAREAVLTISTPETMGVTEATGVMDEPFPVTRIPFFPMLDSGSSFLDLIFAYISLLNLVVISARRKHLLKKKKKIQVYTRESILKSSILTLFFFNVNTAQNVGRRVGTKVIKGKGPQIYQVVPTFNC